jgi:LPS export ABC transporter protein LptC
MLKPNKIKLILATFIVVAGIWLTAVIILKTNQSKGPVEILKQLPKNIDISLQKIHYTDIKDGIKRWTIVADRVEYDKTSDYTYFEKIKMDIFPKGEDTGKISLVADRAAYHNKTGDIEAEGKITASNESGMKFETGRLRYDSTRSMILSEDHVRFSDGKLVVEGTGMEFTPKMKTLKILNNVTARIGARIN